jgi:hypothetical protein
VQPIVCMGGGARQGAVWGWDGASSRLPTSRAQRARPQPPWPAGGGGARRLSPACWAQAVRRGGRRAARAGSWAALAAERGVGARSCGTAAWRGAGSEGRGGERGRARAAGGLFFLSHLALLRRAADSAARRRWLPLKHSFS